jgi:predicted amino acid-binding ACT domain protein
MPSILATVTGPDRPGITARLLAALARADAEVVDMEQVVLRGRLNLGIEFSAPEGTGVIKDLLFEGWEAGVQIAFEMVDDHEPAERRDRHVVSVIGPTLGPADLAAASTTSPGTRSGPTSSRWREAMPTPCERRSSRPRPNGRSMSPSSANGSSVAPSGWS